MCTGRAVDVNTLSKFFLHNANDEAGALSRNHWANFARRINSRLLNAAEKRLLAEWMDLGGQYYNDPYGNGSVVRSVAALDQASFTANVAPILRKSCVGCHQPGGGDGAADFRNNRFVLTGNAAGDFGVTLSMVSDTCNPAANRLLKLPSTVPHPAAAAATVPPQVTAVLPAGSADFNTIAAWILQGCAGS